jgi:hypothetical protein
MKRFKNNFPCTCKHLKTDHRALSVNSNGQFVETGCVYKINKVNACYCYEYVQDNLGYLEMQYERSQKCRIEMGKK